MTVEAQLEQKQNEIVYARGKAESHRKCAARWDAIADAKVKECAVLGTGTLPLIPNDPGYDFRIKIWSKDKSDAPT